ncbi:TolC family outer membrane protein [Nitratireductor indicus]|uniref:TolC family type I secretion outer membrane protein n=1 Tax=Nitratireductor indicus C115 TaxID=1231190 RepID=K2NT57_9HYPH|nr:TolC family outer membrane protein [Nitratireductor indicus]EKF40984.1 TolC family type I secretion outer membrane protein [Nitratireductor indicus C115]MDS1135006.1 TolC family outer membrane protein [Nitratireductor indicus]SFQ73613.1 outer membrane protein [Nitratireductor indicus]
MSFYRRLLVPLIATSALIASPAVASAESILGALAKAYQNNSTLNAERAGVRVTDESVAIAKSGMRPRVEATASAGYTNNDGLDIRTGQFGISLTQPIFDGFQTRNNVQAAESGVRAANEALRNQELDILFNAASAYMDVIRDRQIAALRAQNLQFLEEQVRSSRSRFEVGEGTRTDVAQAEANRQAALAQLSAARASVSSQAAIYQQIIGDKPGELKMANPLVKFLPKSMESAISVGLSEHPVIIARQHQIDAASFKVKSSEGAFLPQVTGSAGLSHNYTNSTPGLSSDGSSDQATVGLKLTVPIYQGGLASATVRQNKESLGQARIYLDVARDQVRAAVVSAWTQYQAARESLVANREVVQAAQLALNGVIEERNVGQRTTLDVLNAQADVITAKINVVSAERDIVVASYAILSAMGRLSATRLGLQVAEYKPQEHYKAVKDKWYGLRTPDGR